MALGDHAEQVSFIAKVHDDKDIVSLFDDLVQGHDIRVSRRELVQSNLPSLEVPLSRVESGTKKALDGEVDGRGGVQVHSEVDNAVCAHAEDRKELETAIVERMADERRTRVGEGLVGHGGSQKVGARKVRVC